MFYASDDAQMFNIGPFESREKAVEDCEEHLPTGAEYWTAEARDPVVRDFLPSAEELIESVKARVTDNATDPDSEKWLEGCSEGVLENLFENFHSIFLVWTRRNNQQIKFTGIDQDTVEHHNPANEG